MERVPVKSLTGGARGLARGRAMPLTPGARCFPAQRSSAPRTWVDGSGAALHLYVGVYGARRLGRRGDDLGPAIVSTRRNIAACSPSALRAAGLMAMVGSSVRELAAPGMGGDRVVWYWFMIGEHGEPQPKGRLEALALISGQAGGPH